MTINRTHKHSYFSMKCTNLEHQVLIFLSYVFVHQRGTSKHPFSDSSNNWEWNLALETWKVSWYTHVIVQHTSIVYWEIFPEKTISIIYITQYLDNMYVTTIVYYNFLYASRCVTWKFYFWLTLVFARFIRAAGEVAS